ncbi:competence/damage-inducible protein A [Alkalibacterium iburiense]|uniref:Putative competence-damage inducible protein n=1 Tax=Alkalibacterium iburiense TaxID=290589 RepID=A0ABN0XGC2_9LACT
MKTEVISIGTELLMGYVVDTNSSTIAKELLGMGMGIYYRQIVGDNPKRLRDSIELATKRSDIIILSGGLGPTKDDITKEVVAEFVGDEIILDPKQLDKITGYYSDKYDTLPDNMYRQAHTLKNGTTFFNEVGLACGTAYERKREGMDSQYFILLPGPPSEMTHMLKHYLKPYLMEHVQNNGVIESLYMNLYGLGESRVAELLDDLIENQTNPTVAIYAKPRQVTVRLTANAPDSKTALSLNKALAKKVLDLVGPYFIGYGEDQTIEAFVVEQLKERQQTLSVIEGFTGGEVMGSLTKISGVSSVFSGGLIAYTNNSNHKVLDLSIETVNEQKVKELAEKSLEKFNTNSALSVMGNVDYNENQNLASGTLLIAYAEKGKETQMKDYPLTERPLEVLRVIAKNEAFAFMNQCLKQSI